VLAGERVNFIAWPFRSILKSHPAAALDIARNESKIRVTNAIAV
jgi:hypothetical protein